MTGKNDKCWIHRALMVNEILTIDWEKGGNISYAARKRVDSGLI